jgi:hypothetical protein
MPSRWPSTVIPTEIGIPERWIAAGLEGFPGTLRPAASIFLFFAFREDASEKARQKGDDPIQTWLLKKSDF